MEGFKYMYVMDFSDSSITEVCLKDEDSKLEANDLLNKYSFNVNTCSWMFTTTKIDNIITYQ